MPLTDDTRKKNIWQAEKAVEQIFAHGNILFRPARWSLQLQRK